MQDPSFIRMMNIVVVILVLVLVFSVYVRFFPTPLSEGFTAATMKTPPTGTSRQQRLTK